MFVKDYINLILRVESNQTMKRVEFKFELYPSRIDFNSAKLELSSNKNKSSQIFANLIASRAFFMLNSN